MLNIVEIDNCTLKLVCNSGDSQFDVDDSIRLEKSVFA